MTTALVDDLLAPPPDGHRALPTPEAMAGAGEDFYRYRARAARQVGPSCPTGIVAPGADELAATLQDWLDEFERVLAELRQASAGDVDQAS